MVTEENAAVLAIVHLDLRRVIKDEDVAVLQVHDHEALPGVTKNGHLVIETIKQAGG